VLHSCGEKVSGVVNFVLDNGGVVIEACCHPFGNLLFSLSLDLFVTFLLFTGSAVMTGLWWGEGREGRKKEWEVVLGRD